MGGHWKMNTENPGERAVELFNSGYNCAEAVLLALGERLGLDSVSLPKAAAAFGGGVARHGMLCGALSGGCIAIGLAEGRTGPDMPRDPAYRDAGDLVDEFVACYGAGDCRTLTGVDFRNQAEAALYRERIHHERCVHYVRFVADWIARRMTGSSIG